MTPEQLGGKKPRGKTKQKVKTSGRLKEKWVVKEGPKEIVQQYKFRNLTKRPCNVFAEDRRDWEMRTPI